MSTDPEADVVGELAAAGKLRSALRVAATLGLLNHGFAPAEREALEAAADILAEKPEVAALFLLALRTDADLPVCTLTYAHTRHVCGSPRCRES